MPLIDGIGDEVIHFFIGLAVTLIVCIAWWTTNITEQPHIRTVFLLERRIRRQRAHSRLTSHVQSTSIVTETVDSAGENNSSENQEQNIESTENITPSDTVKAPAPGCSLPPDHSAGHINSLEEEEQNEIIQTMDSDACVLRQRRLAFYDRQTTLLSGDVTAQASTSAENPEFVNDPSEDITSDPIINPTIMEHNYADQPLEENATGEGSSTIPPDSNDSSIRIKLKYLNDDLRLVDGRLEERLGEFKRRHFEMELLTNKLVRLIFNGQVLQRDSETLQGCGFFDNCVVHCLIHQKRSNGTESGSEERDSSNNNTGRRRRSGRTNNQNREGRDWDLGNILLTLISFILGSAWYFRYEYAHLYTITATVALVAITGIFTVILVAMYFPEAEPRQPHQNVQS